MFSTLVPIVFSVFLLFFLILAGCAVTLLFAAIHRLRQYWTQEKWQRIYRHHQVHGQTVDAAPCTPLPTPPPLLSDPRR